MRKEFHLHNGKKGIALAIQVIPRAFKNEIAEVMSDGTIKIRLNSSPDNQELNATLIDFLSQVLGIPTSQIEIVAGERARSKLISILEIESQVAHERILRNLI
jgi:hypothetical protein